MADVELKSLALKKYIYRELGKRIDEKITEEELQKVRILRLDETILNELLDSSSKDLEVLSNVEVLSITNASIKKDVLKYLDVRLNELIFVNCTGLNLHEFSKYTNITKLTAINCKDANLKDIADFERLEVVNLANNEDLKDSDIKELWSIDTLKEVILDGDSQITDVEHKGIEVSHKDEYRPSEKNAWNGSKSRGGKSLKSIAALSQEEIMALSGEEINITSSDIEFINSPEGQKIISYLGKKNNISLTVRNTAELDMESLKSLKGCNIGKVYVKTGWDATQNRGYSFDTYLKIKQQILKYVDGIKDNPNLTEEQKFIAIRKRVMENIKYDFAALSANSGETDYYTSRNLENGLLYGTCVCAGYADIMKNLLAEVGIESKYVEGYTDAGELHAWNQVKLKGADGKDHWYNDDVTWDAHSQDCGREGFNYCLLDDRSFTRTHRFIASRTEGCRVNACNQSAPLALRESVQSDRMNYVEER